MLKKFNKITLSIFTIFSSALAPTVLSSCSNLQDFYFANFESYMSPNLMEKLKNKFNNLNYRYYGTNENLERSFDRNYDVAIPSTYLVARLASQNKLHKIDWSKFNLSYIDDSGQKVLITNANLALNLFTTDVKSILTNIYDVNGDGKQDDNDNLLNYGVPYFLQDFIMGYKGNNIKSLDTHGTIIPTWNDILGYFGPRIGNKKQFNKIAMIDDYRTIYSIPRLIESQGAQVNPSKFNKTISIDEFEKTYSYMLNYFSELNSFLLNSDSGTILNDFANIKGSDVGIMYNGDLLYAMLGGDEYSENLENSPFFTTNNEPLKSHFIRPQQTLIALDMMVINKNTHNLQTSYDLIKEVALNGVSSEFNIWEEDENGDYIYGPMINFDYILYTSPIQKIHNYVLYGDNPNDTNQNYRYFDYLYDYGFSDEFVNMCIGIFDIQTHPTPDNMIEQNLSELNKSNMFYGYSRIKSRL